MSDKKKFEKIEDEIKRELKDLGVEDGKVSPSEAARIQSTDLPSGDPGLTPVKKAS